MKLRPGSRSKACRSAAAIRRLRASASPPALPGSKASTRRSLPDARRRRAVSSSASIATLRRPSLCAAGLAQNAPLRSASRAAGLPAEARKASIRACSAPWISKASVTPVASRSSRIRASSPASAGASWVPCISPRTTMRCRCNPSARSAAAARAMGAASAAVAAAPRVCLANPAPSKSASSVRQRTRRPVRRPARAVGCRIALPLHGLSARLRASGGGAPPPQGRPDQATRSKLKPPAGATPAGPGTR